MKKKSMLLVMILALSILPYSVSASGICGVIITKNPLYSGYTYPDGTWVDSDPLSGLSLGEQHDWYIEIKVWNKQPTLITDVVLFDRFGAEFGVEVIDYTGGIGGSAPETWTKGKSEKVFLKWEIGTLGAGDEASIWLHVYTDINPAGHQEFTSPGEYYLNSGAVVKWLENGKKNSAETGSIIVTTEGV